MGVEGGEGISDHRVLCALLSFSLSPFDWSSLTWSLLRNPFDQAFEDLLGHQRAVDETVGHFEYFSFPFVVTLDRTERVRKKIEEQARARKKTLFIVFVCFHREKPLCFLLAGALSASSPWRRRRQHQCAATLACRRFPLAKKKEQLQQEPLLRRRRRCRGRRRRRMPRRVGR